MPTVGLTAALLSPVVVALLAVTLLMLELARRTARHRASLDRVTSDLGRDWITGLMSYARWCQVTQDPRRFTEAVAVIRLQGVDRVEDVHGGDARRAVLRVTARRLAELVGQRGDLARWDGGTYVLAVLAGEGGKLNVNAIVTRLSERVEHDGERLPVGAVKVGVAYSIEIKGGGVEAMQAEAERRSRRAAVPHRWDDRQPGGATVYASAAINAA